MVMAEPKSVVDLALRKLADQLECGICLDSYTDPKLLHCFHVFCKNCLEHMVLRNLRGLSLCCPTCRQSSLLPAHSVSGLQPAFHIHHLFEIQDALKKVKKGQEGQKTHCEKCNKSREAHGFCRDCSSFVCEFCIEMHQSWKEFSTHEVISLEQLKSDVTNLVPLTKKTLYCSKHPEKELDLYCETDDELICRDCIVRTHRDHQYDLVSEAFPKHRDAIATHLQPVKQQLSIVNQAIQGLDTRHDRITDQQAAIEADIHKRIQQLHEALEVTKTELIGQLDQLTQQKLKSLCAQRDELQLTQTRLNSCLEFVSESLKTGSKGEILGMKKSVVQQAKEMSAEFNPDKLLHQEQADMKFTASSELFPACKQFGQVYCDQVCPEKSRIMGEGVKASTVGEQSTVTVHAIDSEGSKCDKPLPDTIVSCELVCCSDAKRMRCDVKHIKVSEYEIYYQPTATGRHELHVKIEGQHIRGSPFAVIARRKKLLSLGPTKRTITDIIRPWGVAVNEREQIIVARYEGHSISIYSPNGDIIKTIGRKGSAPGQFYHPRGIAVDRDGNILVVDSSNCRIQKFTEDGNFVTSIGRKGDRPCEFVYPTGIGIGPDDKVYICDHFNDRVQILNPDLTFSSSFGSSGSGDGQFNAIYDVAFDSRGNVYVADGMNYRIQVFTKDGRFLRKFGKCGTGFGELNYPSGIAIDYDDMVYVTEYDNNRISLFTSEGECKHMFGSKGNSSGKFLFVRGVAVDRVGFVYISDVNNGRLQIC